MSFINRRKQDASVATAAPEVSQEHENELTPRQQVNHRISSLRKRSNLELIQSVSFGVITAGYVLQGESHPLVQVLESRGVDKPVLFAIYAGMVGLSGVISVGNGIAGASHRAEAISLAAGMEVSDVLVAEQAERQMVVMPQPELQWRAEHE